MTLALSSTAFTQYLAGVKNLRAARQIGPVEQDALVAIGFAVESGNDTPTLREIAAMADGSKKTVSTAIAKAGKFGLLSSEARFTVVHGIPRQLANRYMLRSGPATIERKQRKPRSPRTVQTAEPAEPAEPADGGNDNGTSKKKESLLFLPSRTEAAREAARAKWLPTLPPQNPEASTASNGRISMEDLLKAFRERAEQKMRENIEAGRPACTPFPGAAAGPGGVNRWSSSNPGSSLLTAVQDRVARRLQAENEAKLQRQAALWNTPRTPADSVIPDSLFHVEQSSNHQQ